MSSKEEHGFYSDLISKSYFFFNFLQDSVTKILNITQNRNDVSLNTEKFITKTANTNITSLNLPNNKTKNVANTTTTTAAVAANNNSNNSSNYQCNLCDFTSVRQNVMILHRKMHSNRNSIGSGNNTTNTSITATTTKATTLARAGTLASKITTSTTNANNDKNQLQQNQIVVSSKDNKTNNKTKASTITTPTTATGKTRTTRTTPTAIKEPITTANETEINTTSESVETPKEKTTSTRSTRLQQNTNTSAVKTIKTKTAKKTAVKEKKTESAYAAILSDFCPSETETENEASPSLEETHNSRRSLRNGKHLSESSTGKTSAICIDLSEPKTIQKIPKKRGYSSLPSLERENSTQLTTSITLDDGDVVCLADKEQESSTTTTTATTPNPAKKDAEDIRRMLLADWSDDDETPTDAIVVEDSSIVETRTESSVCITQPENDKNSSLDVVLTSTPVVTKASATTSTGRIRNIPKKDRRDVVLQDFNSDLSAIQNDHGEQANKSAAVDLDSSNSSVVEIIEDEQPAAIITINDDEDRELSKPANVSEFNETRNEDSVVSLANDKSASAATSTTTLSCFDFQEDEDEQDNAAPTISHFKKN